MQKNPRHLKDQELLELATTLAAAERRTQLAQIHVFSEIVRRKLFAKRGYESLFTYLVEELGFSKSCAYKRHIIARVARQFPQIIRMLGGGQYTLTSAALVAKSLTAANHKETFEKTAGKSAAEIELILAAQTMQKPGRDIIKFMGRREGSGAAATRQDGANAPAPVPAGDRPVPSKGGNFEGSKAEQSLNLPCEPAPPAEVDPSDVFVRVNFTTTQRVQKKLERVKELLARKVPSGALSEVFEQVLDDYIERHDPLVKAERAEVRAAKKDGGGTPAKPAEEKVKSRFANEPEARFACEPRRVGKEARANVVGCGGRYIPAAVRHAVMRRDGGQCTHVGPDGRRCGARRYLDLDHIRPFALGGRSDEVENIRLLCKLHNQLRARETYGEIRTKNGGEFYAEAPSRKC